MIWMLLAVIVILGLLLVDCVQKYIAAKKDLAACNGMYGLLQSSYNTAVAMRKRKEEALLKAEAGFKENCNNSLKQINDLKDNIKQLKEHYDQLRIDYNDIKKEYDSAQHRLSKLERPRCVRCGKYIDGYLGKTKPGEICDKCFSRENSAISFIDTGYGNGVVQC